MTKDFKSITEAFEWFMENVYPELPPEQKHKLKDVKYDHYKRDDKNVSDKRMKKVLNEHNYALEFIVRLHEENKK